MNYSALRTCDVANGPGVRVTLFVSGCRIHCKNCFNPEAQDFNHGEPFTQEVQDKILKELKKPQIEGLSILGGEPLEPENAEVLVDLCRAIRKKFGADKSIWVWTGYNIEKFCGKTFSPQQQLLGLVDHLVDGPFIEEQKDISLTFRGSRNQRILELEHGIVAKEVNYKFDRK